MSSTRSMCSMEMCQDENEAEEEREEEREAAAGDAAALFGAVEGYARGIKVDTARLEDAVGQLDPANPEALQEALQQGMFQPEDTPEQKAALARLETALALVEGWVDAVVHAAAAPHLPSAGALRETLRRRRATATVSPR